MESQIELYPHNQIAYDKLCDMLSQSNRACVIQPTGTGKFVIIAKLVQDNPDKRFLLLGTNDYMFIDQMDNLEKIAPGFHPDNLQFKTYSAAMVHARSEHVTLQYDYIILDEFHHCGAPEWSKGVQWFIDGSPDAKRSVSVRPQFASRMTGEIWPMRFSRVTLPAAWSLRRLGFAESFPSRSTSSRSTTRPRSWAS